MELPFEENSEAWASTERCCSSLSWYGEHILSFRLLFLAFQVLHISQLPCVAGCRVFIVIALRTCSFSVRAQARLFLQLSDRLWNQPLLKEIWLWFFKTYSDFENWLNSCVGREGGYYTVVIVVPSGTRDICIYMGSAGLWQGPWGLAARLHTSPWLQIAPFTNWKPLPVFNLKASLLLRMALCYNCSLQWMPVESLLEDFQ